jgi:hypothetical protein
MKRRKEGKCKRNAKKEYHGSDLTIMHYVYWRSEFWAPATITPIINLLSFIDWFYGVRLRLWTAATNGHIVHTPDDMGLESDGGMLLTGENERTRRKPCPSAILSTTNPVWIDPGANPGLGSDRLATNRLSHGTAQVVVILNIGYLRVHLQRN